MPPATAPALQEAPGLDGEFVRLARQIPGFGGYWFDEEGDLVVSLTDPSQEAAARAAVQEVAGRRPLRGTELHAGPAAVRVRKRNYDFVQLNAWRNRLRLAALPGVVTLDADEVANRVHVGVQAGRAAEVEAALGGLGIPRGAVVIDVATPVRQLATLTDQVRPVVGGLRVGWSSGTNSDFCTLGANVYFGTVTGFLTASHCGSMGTSDNAVFYQGSELIGREYLDPPFRAGTGWPCPAGRWCRYADAMLARYDPAFPVSNIGLGKIANTFPGGITINPWRPHHQLNQVNYYTVVGEFLEKVGWATGHTRGTVSRSCFDHRLERRDGTLSDSTLLCQSQVDSPYPPSLMSQGGDSGAPVFGLTSTGAYFSGILWGGPAGGGTFYIFSPIWNIQQDLGGWLTFF